MPIIKLKSSSIIESVNLRGQPTASDTASSIATTQMVNQEISNLISGAPELLNTLGELSKALDSGNTQTE